MECRSGYARRGQLSWDLQVHGPCTPRSRTADQGSAHPAGQKRLQGVATPARTDWSLYLATRNNSQPFSVSKRADLLQDTGTLEVYDPTWPGPASLRENMREELVRQLEKRTESL